MLKLYLVQMEVVLNDKAANFGKVRRLLDRSGLFKGAASGNKPAGLIVLPEMFATGYIPEVPAMYAEDFSQASAGETAKFLSELANETGCAILGAGISKAKQAVAGKPCLQNHSSLYLPGNTREAACYNKRRPFFPEVDFVPGDSVNLFKIEQWIVSTAICYDLRFPELFRDAVKAGARLVTIQAAWPKVRIEHWITLLKARAIENQVYIAAVNQVGGNPPELGGNSMIISPTGEILVDDSVLKNKGTSPAEGVIYSTVLSAPQEEYRQKFPVLSGIV